MIHKWIPKLNALFVCCQHITYCDWVETFDEFLALEFAQDFFHSVKVKVTLGSDLPGPYALRTTLLYDLIYNLKHKHKPSLMHITVSLLKQYYTLISIWCLWYKFSLGKYFNYCISRLLFKSLHYSNYIWKQYYNNSNYTQRTTLETNTVIHIMHYCG